MVAHRAGGEEQRRADLAVVVAPAALILWAPRARMATAWFMVLLGVAFQGYRMALIQRGVIDRLRETSR